MSNPEKNGACPDALLPDGEVCPRCGGPRAPSGVDGGSWVHFPRASLPPQPVEGGAERSVDEGELEYRRNLVADLRAIHTSAFINDEVLPRAEKADMLHFIYLTCIRAANELEELCPTF